MDRPHIVSSSSPAAAPVTPVTPDRATLERQKVTELAQEFESIMMLQMLRQMRETMIDEEEGEKGLSADIMTDTVNSELARQLSRGGGIGIADSLLRAMDRRTELAPAGALATGSGHALSAAPAVAGTAEAGHWAPVPSAAPYLHTHEPVAAAGKGVAMTSPYGWRADPFTGAQKYHAGIDLGAAYGTAVPAAAGGRVVSVGELGAYGTQVVIEHATGLQTRYAHLSVADVRVGQQVEQGQEIGRVGQSGRATGPHLHFEVIRNGQRVDPTGVMALGGSGFDGLKLMGSDADFPVGGRASQPSTTGADDENRGQQPKS